MTIRTMGNVAGWMIVLAVVAGLIAPHVSGVVGIALRCVFVASLATSLVFDILMYRRRKNVM